jgi:bifunctional UDP-N-acetylglucosamine pyrophosphorylase/glucosamine-1-phosphate N-acetyltransferase
LKALPRLKANNAKREYYLTDVVALLNGADLRVGVVRASDVQETQGVNTRIELAQAENEMRQTILRQWMLAGVTIVDPATTYISAEARLSADTTLWPGTIIRGASRIGSGCEIGPYTVIENASVADGVKVGPFARLRPGAVIESGAHIGNFVEIKKSRVGRGSKVNHLAYIGDTTIGAGANIGAGVITCNYDGYRKSPTFIGDGAFIGSNANLVAPVRVGRGAIIGAGSTITKDVAADALGIERAQQLVKKKWAYGFRKKHENKGR